MMEKYHNNLLGGRRRRGLGKKKGVPVADSEIPDFSPLLSPLKSNSISSLLLLYVCMNKIQCK